MDKKKISSLAKSKATPIGRDIAALIGIFFGALLLVSVFTYDHQDPSLFSQTKRIPINYAGRIGANLSEIFLQVFGMAAFVLPPFIVLFSLELVRRKKNAPRLIQTAFWQITALLSLTTLLGLLFGPIFYGGASLAPGGWLGQQLAGISSHYLNRFGAVLILMAALLVAVVFSTPVTTTQLLRGVGLFAGVVWTGFATAGKYLKKYAGESLAHIKARRVITQKLQSKSSEKLVIEAPQPAKRTSSLHAVGVLSERPNGLVLLDDANPAPESASSKKKTAVKEKKVTQFSGKYELPPLSFLNHPEVSNHTLDRERLVENSKILEQKLTDFGIEGSVVAVRPGPVITMYEFKPGPGVKISQIAALADDLSLALSAQSVRIVAPIPGKSVVGIEIPNDEREKVYLREILSTEEFQGSNQTIPLAVGKDIAGTPVTTDLARMPHLLIAGAPGAGKSVFINSVICSLLYKFTPHDMRLLMVDPKQLELNLYDNIPHLLLPVVDDPKKASTALKWAVNEMERRYKIMAKLGVRNLAGFNEKLENDGPEKTIKTLCPMTDDGMPESESLSHLFEHDSNGKPVIERMPFVLVIIDEFADLMMVAPKDIETSVARLAQKARAAGIHLIIATQRPSVDVITGLIKANLPSRISFQVASKMDSRTILDSIGSEKLLGQGDMLFIPPGLSRLTRIHGAFVKEDEIEKICDHWRSQGAPVFKEEILLAPDEANAEEADGAGDELYQQAITIVRELGQASASMLQRRLKVGYNRAARMIEAMEMQGIVGPADGARPREVLY